MITPGAVNTEATDAAKEVRKTSRPVPATDPDEVARVAFMLTTGISDYMYGSYITVDGGAYLGIE